MTLETIIQEGYEKIVKVQDAGTGLSAYIAIHNTTLGPALGGCRMWPYASQSAALSDVLRLSQSMTLKNALAGLNLGGGKAVIIGDPKTDKSPALFEAFGRAVQSLNGDYYTAIDVGVTTEDIGHSARQTEYVAGLTQDPSLFTAYGVFIGLKATAKRRLGADNLHGVKVIVTGLGQVGFELCRLLAEAGAELIVADIDLAKVRTAQDQFGADEAHPLEAFAKPADIFSPCALGGVLNSATVPLLQVAAIAGAANNQLAQRNIGDILHQQGILYAPDYAINAGGVISIADEIAGTWNRERVLAHCARITDTLGTIFDRSATQDQATNRIADNLAADRLNNPQQKNKRDDAKGVA